MPKSAFFSAKISITKQSNRIVHHKEIRKSVQSCQELHLAVYFTVAVTLNIAQFPCHNTLYD